MRMGFIHDSAHLWGPSLFCQDEFALELQEVAGHLAELDLQQQQQLLASSLSEDAVAICVPPTLRFGRNTVETR
jgi:hypothetical protein